MADTRLLAEEVRELVEELRGRVWGEVRFDPYSRVLYATDSSPYQILPLGVVVPASEEDVLATVEACARFGVPLLPRGAGTSLSGQAVGRAVVLDFSKHLNQVLEINREERWARVQPGAVLDVLNGYCRPHGLMFPPDPATASRCTIGGMVANNSSGAHSILYRKTLDHTLELRVAFADGEVAWLTDLVGEELERELESGGIRGEAMRTVLRLAREHREEIERRYPKIMRRVAGYNLDEFVRDQPFNLSRVIVGSEGTLAPILETKLNLVETPPGSAVMVVHFHSLYQALDSVVPILETGPSAVELLDEIQIRMARESLEYSRRMGFLQGEPRTLLIVEYYGASEGELRARLDDLEKRLRVAGSGYAYARALEEEAKADIWAVRKAGLGLFLAMRGEAKPVSFIEDAAVPVERLPEYIRRVHVLLEELGIECGHYGHASVGLVHLRPIMNLKDPRHVELIHTISERITAVLLELGGALSGEHGDGLARSMWIPTMFGPTLYHAFRELKRAFDPQGIMNPGKIVDAPDMRQNLRYGPGYRAEIGGSRFRYPDGSQEAHVEACAGVGECRKTTGGTMCPSYMVTLEEEHSTRGRANALRAAMSGLLPPEELHSERMREVLDLCIECKGCRAECPINVDMAKLKAEFLERYYRHHRMPLRARLFAHVHALSRWGSRLAPLANLGSGSRVGRLALAGLGIAYQRRLPPFARHSLESWYRRSHPNGAGNEHRDTVILFHDTFTTYNYPEVGVAAVRLLESGGFRVLLAEGRVCCGRPMISKGLLSRVRAQAQANLAALSECLEQGWPVVGLEPSCLLTFRDEYVELLDDPRAEALARQSFLLEEFLLRHEHRFRPLLRPREQHLLVHGHCHQKALVGAGPLLRVLSWIPGTGVELVDSGCCGMAGSFGFEAEHFHISLQMGERRLFPAVRSHWQGPVVAAGVSCRQQILQGTGRRALHPAEVLAASL